MKEYRIYCRLDPKEPEELTIIEKIQDRDKATYATANSYVRSALAAYGKEDSKVLKELRRIREEMNGNGEEGEGEKTGSLEAFPLLSEL